MFRPKRHGGEHVSPRWSAAADDYLFLEGRTIASASFRFLIWCNGPWSAPANRAGLLAIFDLFLSRWRAGTRSLTRPDPSGRFRTRPADEAAILALRADLEAGLRAADLPIRLAGWVDDPHYLKAPPCLRIDAVGDLAVLAVELPHEDADLVRHADEITVEALRMNLSCGVAGFGFYLPSYLESLIFALPMTTTRLAAAIEIAPTLAATCIRPDSTDRDDDGRHLAAGLPDLGWRTLIGPSFLDRLPDLAGLRDVPGVGLLQAGDAVAITAGAAPVWGRLQDGEDLRVHRAIAEHLRPLRCAPRLAERHLFGEDTEDPDRIARVRAYLRRFDG